MRRRNQLHLLCSVHPRRQLLSRWSQHGKCRVVGYPGNYMNSRLNNPLRLLRMVYMLQYINLPNREKILVICLLTTAQVHKYWDFLYFDILAENLLFYSFFSRITLLALLLYLYSSNKDDFVPWLAMLLELVAWLGMNISCRVVQEAVLFSIMTFEFPSTWLLP